MKRARGLDAWTRQAGRQQVSSIKMNVGVDRTRSLRATTGSTVHCYRCSHCPTTENKAGEKAHHCRLIRSHEIEDAGCYSTRDSCSRDVQPPAVRPCDSRGNKMRPPHAPTSSHMRPIGHFLEMNFDMRLPALRKVYSTGREAHLGRVDGLLACDRGSLDDSGSFGVVRGGGEEGRWGGIQ